MSSNKINLNTYCQYDVTMTCKPCVTPYAELCLQSLDIILTEGNGRLSKAIQTTQKLRGAPKEEARVSHVAAIIKHDNNLFVQESTTFNKWANKKGVQENPLEQWLDNYDGHVWVKRLNFMRTSYTCYTDWKFWSEFGNMPYENGIAGFFELLWCGLQFNTTIKKWFPNWKPMPTEEPHCAELVGWRLSTHGLLTSKFYRQQSFNRLPPWFWVSEIDKYINVPVKPLVQIK